MSISKIYMIKDKTNNKVFISHTVRQLDDIMSLHESAYDMYTQGEMAYKPSFDILKNKNYSIELLEEVAIKNNNDLLKRIKYYGTKYDNVIKVEETPINDNKDERNSTTIKVTKPGRPANSKNVKLSYEIYQKNLLTDNYVSLGKFKTFNEMSEYLKSVNISLTTTALNKIFLAKHHKYLKIEHL